MRHFNHKDLWTIPNIICYIRILLIPVFTYIYVTADSIQDYHLAGIIVLISSFTDLFDGMIARRFNMVTDLGKVLDPVADKLTHAALAVCLAVRYPLMKVLFAVMLIKEGYMAVMGIIMLKKGKMLDGAMWYGKVCTSLLFTGLFILFLFPSISIHLANTIIAVLLVSMLYTLIRYFGVYRQMLREGDEKNV